MQTYIKADPNTRIVLNAPGIIGRRQGTCWVILYRHPDGHESRTEGRPGQGIVSVVEDLVQTVTAYAVRADAERASPRAAAPLADAEREAEELTEAMLNAHPTTAFNRRLEVETDR